MIHLGDITKISGYNAPIVDCVVGGSPCQDLSVAGKRAGLDGERSGLFMEQLRIIKEMRDNDVRTNGRSGVAVRPRYMVWENVPGAFSSNKGEDFRVVLEETAKIADKDANVPMPDTGKWQTSGCILGDGWSIAWRVLDAQFWGVPQRRRRIALVADFGGQSAPEILFVRQSVSRDIEQSQPKGEATSSDAEGSVGANDRLGADQYNATILGDTVSTLGVNCGMSHGRQCVLEPIEIAYSFEPGIASREGGHIYEGVSGTLRANMGDNQMAVANIVLDDQGGQQVNVRTDGVSPTLRAETHGNLPCVVEQAPSYTMKIRSGCDIDAHGKAAGKGALIQTEKSGTLSCVQDQYLFQPVYSVENHPADSRVDIDDTGKVQTLTSRMGTGGGNVTLVMEQTVFSKSRRAQTSTDYETWKESCIANTLNAFDQGDVRTNECVIALDRASYNQGRNAQFDIGISESGNAQSLVAKGPGAVCYTPTVNCQYGTRYIVRRLTPLECERLQGYPDGWTDIGEYTDTNGKKKQSSDAARYKALGNSIAIPPWKWVMKRLCSCYERDATLASLFDGIGGFPYIWEQINGKGSCLWASEIEEFPIAVTKGRIGE